MSRCFDRELNEVSCTRSALTPPKETSSNAGSETRAHHTDDDTQFTSCCKNKSSHDDTISKQYRTNLSSYDVERGNLEAGVTPATRTVASSAAPRFAPDSLDDDVSWFFEDASDADGGCERQTVINAPQFISRGVAVSDIGDKVHKTTLLPCDTAMSAKDVNGCTIPTFSAIDLCDENGWAESSDQCAPESLDAGNSRELSTNESASLRSSLEYVGDCTGNVMQSYSVSHMAQELQQTDKMLTGRDESKTDASAQFCLATVPRVVRSSAPLLATDPKSILKQSSNDKSFGKCSLQTSRILRRSRHFRSVKNTICCSTSGEDNLSDKIIDDMHDCGFQLSSLEPRELSSCVNSHETSESRLPSGHQSTNHVSIINQTVSVDPKESEVDGSCFPQQADIGEINVAYEKIEDQKPESYFRRLETIGMCLSHGDDEMMRLAVDICCRQLTVNPSQTWFVV